MSKNIIICCDGTGNEFSDRNSNVVKLFQVLLHKADEQIAFYDPGVGTSVAPQEVLFSMTKKLQWIIGLGCGYGLARNVVEAYRYLMKYYETGDRVFLFGFSRGAYTVRVLAGMLHKVGLLGPGAEHLIPYAFHIFEQNKNDHIANAFKKTFSRPGKIHFVGVWDTVSTVGWIYNPITYPYTRTNRSVRVFRHAVSIDERRTHFRTNLFNPSPNQNCKQVWFSGVHADIGGGYPELESGLSKIALEWMVREAKENGLLIDQDQYDRIIPKQNSSKYVAPDSSAVQHDELDCAGWRIVEHIPRCYTDLRSGDAVRRWKWNPIKGFYRRRPIPDNSLIHASVMERQQKKGDYKPENMPALFQVEE